MASVADLYPAPDDVAAVWSACVSPGIAPEGHYEAKTPGWKWIWRFVA